MAAEIAAAASARARVKARSEELRARELERDQRVAAEIAVAASAGARVKVGRDERQTREPAVGPVSAWRDTERRQNESSAEGHSEELRQVAGLFR